MDSTASRLSSAASVASGSASTGGRTLPLVRPTRAVGTAVAVALLALALAAGPVAAATTIVTMDNSYDFSPSSVTVSRGVTVRWENNASYVPHDVKGTAPSSYFTSGAEAGMDPGESYSKTFKSAGSFPYICRIHQPSMDGRVVVRMGASRIVDGGVVKFKLELASEALSSSSPFRHVVWVDTPSGSWQIFKTTTKATVTYVPSASGTYYFRSEVKRVSNGSTSDWSPTRSLTK